MPSDAPNRRTFLRSPRTTPSSAYELTLRREARVRLTRRVWGAAPGSPSSGPAFGRRRRRSPIHRHELAHVRNRRSAASGLFDTSPPTSPIDVDRREAWPRAVEVPVRRGRCADAGGRRAPTTLAGDTVNVAARLQSFGDLVLGQTTAPGRRDSGSSGVTANAADEQTLELHLILPLRLSNTGPACRESRPPV